MLWIALAFTQLPLEARWRNDAEPVGPRAIVRKHRVTLCNPAAEVRGVRVGQKRSLAIEICPGLRMADPDDPEQAAALDEVALALARFTPAIAFVRSASGTRGLLLEAGGSLKLFGGFHALLHAIRFTVSELGLSVDLAAFTTATGAWLLAQHGMQSEHALRHLLEHVEASAHDGSGSADDPLHALDSLPTPLLDTAYPCADVLVGIGCGRLGALRHFPREELIARFGAGLLDEVDRAYGLAPDPRDFWSPPERFEARLELMARVDHAEALLFGGRRLLVQLVGWLGARQATTRAIALHFDHERHRDNGPRHSSLYIRLSEPTRDLEHLALLLREHLARTVLPAPVLDIRLEATEVEIADGASGELFRSRASDDQAIARFAERVAARLGPHAVRTIALRDDHRPEAAQVLQPFGAIPPRRVDPRRQTRIGHVEHDRQTLPRPAWLLSRPVQLRIRNQRPWHHGDLRLLAGPERVESGWWNDTEPPAPAVRDYFIAENHDAELLWLFRERKPGGDEHWFLHGKFA
ncbi:Y-family DNA polymerase [Derxia gummosa]|uniref:Y-family DNA polymerase n=1 Tax=Derxia gummosa DSM 723 TaxID=1121388 RepID=A0A8B6X9P6_9BURK|nr:DNA polymerase Y family protein [Derxia gummosa]